MTPALSLLCRRAALLNSMTDPELDSYLAHLWEPAPDAPRPDAPHWFTPAIGCPSFCSVCGYSSGKGSPLHLTRRTPVTVTTGQPASAARQVSR